jgi:hypothetical protein
VILVAVSLLLRLPSLAVAPLVLWTGPLTPALTQRHAAFGPSRTRFSLARCPRRAPLLNLAGP